MRAHAFDHLDREAHAVQFAAAVFVVAQIRERREELMDQVAVRAMDIEHLEARLVRAPRRLAPALDHLGDFRMRQRARRRIALRRVHRARRDKLPRVPVGDLGRRLERPAALPRPEAPRLAPRMPELDARHRVVQADEIDAALQAGNEGVVPQAEIADRAAAAPLDLGGFHDDEAGAARRVAPRIHQVPVGREAVDGRILMHRRDHDAVLQASRRGWKSARTASGRPYSVSIMIRRASCAAVETGQQPCTAIASSSSPADRGRARPP